MVTASEGVSRTPRLEQLLLAAEQIARDSGSPVVGVEHFQLAILGDRDAIPTQVLVKMGWDPAEFATHLRALMDSDSYHGRTYRVSRLDGEVTEHPNSTYRAPR